MKKADMKALGIKLGMDFAREMGTTWHYNTGEGLEKAQEMVSLAFESYSQFSPWEFTAAAMNASWNADYLWEALYEGLNIGARKWFYEESRGCGHQMLNNWGGIVFLDVDVNGEWIEVREEYGTSEGCKPAVYAAGRKKMWGRGDDYFYRCRGTTYSLADILIDRNAFQ